MPKRLRIRAGEVTSIAVLNETPTATAIWQALPIEARANTWGDEIYFSIPVHQSVESKASDVVALGDVAYWPPGNAFCIFFGPTPASHGNEIRAASAVNVVGRLEGDPTTFRKVSSGTRIVLEAIETRVEQRE